MTESELERVRLNLRIPTEAKEAFEDAIREKYGYVGARAGIVLEDELSAIVDNGPIAQLYDAAEAVASACGQAEGKKKIPDVTPDVSDTTVTQYRIREDIRDRVESIAEREDYRSPGRFIGAVMWSYALGRGLVDKTLDTLDRVKEFADADVDDTLSSQESNTQKIIEGLGGEDTQAFSIEDFNEAVDDHPNLKISASDHVREEYLPRVLDELDLTWHPNPESDVFVSPESVDIPEVRDPRSKPKPLTSKKDTRLALAVDAVEKDLETSHARKYEKNDAVGINGISYSNAAGYMKKVGKMAGFTYDDREGVLKLNRSKIQEPLIVDLFTDSSAEESEDVQDDEQDDAENDGEESAVDSVVDTLDTDNLEDKEPELQRQIIATSLRPAYNNEIDIEDVPDDEIDAVCERLGLSDAISSDDEPAEESDKQDDEIEANTDATFDALEGATALTDGGQIDDSYT